MVIISCNITTNLPQSWFFHFLKYRRLLQANTSCPVAKSRLIWRVSIRFRQRAGDRHGTHNTPSPLTTLGTALTYTMPYGFPTFHPLRTSFCMFRSRSVSHRHSTSDDVPMGGGTPQRKIEKRHSRRAPVLHPVQKRCEPSKTSIGVRRLWFFYPANNKIPLWIFFWNLSDLLHGGDQINIFTRK